MIQTAFDDMGVFSDGCNIRRTAIHIALVPITGYQAALTSRSPGENPGFHPGYGAGTGIKPASPYGNNNFLLQWIETKAIHGLPFTNEKSGTLQVHYMGATLVLPLCITLALTVDERTICNSNV